MIGGGLIGCGLILGGGRFRGRDQDFAELDGFRLFHLALMLVVELLLFFLGYGEVLAYFFANHLLGNHLVAQVLLEVLVGEALGRGRFFEIFHAFQFHFLAHLVEPLDEFGVAGEAEVLALFEQKLLIN